MHRQCQATKNIILCCPYHKTMSLDVGNIVQIMTSFNIHAQLPVIADLSILVYDSD